MSVRYLANQAGAYRYRLVTSQVPTCRDLGEHRQVRAWSREASRYELCELTDRRLRHLSALIVAAPPAYEMYIFSQDYVTADAEFERRLRALPDPLPAAR
jgi:hypothetical protein